MTIANILRERRGDVLVLTLNRPELLNAASPEMFSEFRGHLDTLDGARSLLIKGAGRAFCAGADISGQTFTRDTPGDRAAKALREHYNPTILSLANLDIPIVSAVRGPAAGIGCSLALAADLCVASDSAYFLQAFANIGLACDGGATYTLARLVGRARAMEMALLGERLPAKTALEWGLIHRLVPDAELDAVTDVLSKRLAVGPTVALGRIRRGISAALDIDLAAALDSELEDQRAAGNSVDAAEGMAAFRSKRPAKFIGK